MKLTEPLTVAESETLADKEQIILGHMDSMLRVAEALTVIRDQRLYRGTHKTFQAYCEERLGFSRQHGYRLIEFAQSSKTDLSPTGDKLTERAFRELAKVPQAQRKEVVEKAAARGRVTAKAIRAAAATTPEQEDPEQPKPTQDAEFVAACGKPKLPKLPWPLIEAMDLAYESLRLAKDADFEPDFEAMHQIARDVRKAANELDRYAKTMFERKEQ